MIIKVRLDGLVKVGEELGKNAPGFGKSMAEGFLIPWQALRETGRYIHLSPGSLKISFSVSPFSDLYVPHLVWDTNWLPAQFGNKGRCAYWTKAFGVFVCYENPFSLQINKFMFYQSWAHCLAIIRFVKCNDLDSIFFLPSSNLPPFHSSNTSILTTLTLPCEVL